LGSLDELYKGRKEYYLNKARKIIESMRNRWLEEIVKNVN
jgi:hypothetical protein